MIENVCKFFFEIWIKCVLLNTLFGGIETWFNLIVQMKYVLSQDNYISVYEKYTLIMYNIKICKF